MDDLGRIGEALSRGRVPKRYRTASIARRQLGKVFSARSFGCRAAILRSADGEDSTVDTVQVKRLDVRGRPGERALGLQLLCPEPREATAAGARRST